MNIFYLSLTLIYFSYLAPEWVVPSVCEGEEEGGGKELSIGCAENDDDEGGVSGGWFDWP